MGKIEANFFISLDGVVESPDQWHFDYFNDEMGAAIGLGTERYTGFLMGRVLYEEWSSFWPNQGDDVPFAPFIKRLFEDTPTYPLELVSHETFKTGVLNLSYAPASEQ